MNSLDYYVLVSSETARSCLPGFDSIDGCDILLSELLSVLSLLDTSPTEVNNLLFWVCSVHYVQLFLALVVQA